MCRTRHAGAVVATAGTLVTSGLYRYSRNPMYIGVLLDPVRVDNRSAVVDLRNLCGGRRHLRRFHLRVLLHEEPFLARTHGEAWTAYRARVGRWLG